MTHEPTTPPDPATVVVIGAANVDLEATVDGPVSLGDSNIASLRRGAGGVARNIAANLARLDVATALLTVFDDGPDGRWLAAVTARDGVDVGPSLHLPDATSTYVAVVDADGDLVIGVNDLRGVDRIDPAVVEDRREVIGRAQWVVIDANLPAATIAHLAATFPDARVVAEPVSATKAQRLRGNLDWVDTVKPNRGELAALADHPVTGPADVDTAIDDLLRRGVRQVVVSMAADGVVVATHDERHHLPAPAGPITSVTGAGDAMTAGLVVGLVEGWSVRRAAHFAQCVAMLTAASPRTVAEHLSRRRVHRLLREDER